MFKFMRSIIKKTEKQLIEEFIIELKGRIKKKNNLKQNFSMVLTGGPSPINLYKSLSKAKINWSNVDFFIGDERFVPSRSKYSNFRLAHKYLIKKIKIKKKNIYFINTDKKKIIESVIDYEKKIRKYFNNRKVSFDLILLGMGIDGHIASIFSNNLNLKTNKICSANTQKDFKRITLNLKTINNSKKIILWLNNKNIVRIYKKIRYKKKVPVNCLDKRKISIFRL